MVLGTLAVSPHVCALIRPLFIFMRFETIVVAPRFRSSCTQKRATNANSSSHDDSKDTRTARNLQGVENAFQPARITK